jgi:hypothetical protein
MVEKFIFGTTIGRPKKDDLALILRNKLILYIAFLKREIPNFIKKYFWKYLIK